MILIIIHIQVHGTVHTAVFTRDIIRARTGIHGTATLAGVSDIPGTITETGTTHVMHTAIILTTDIIPGITADTMAAPIIETKKMKTMIRKQENTVPTGWPVSESPADPEQLFRE